ncbi:MAG: RHS repeat-associated core domain-containing protein [Chloroflexota bacterium]
MGLGATEWFFDPQLRLYDADGNLLATHSANNSTYLEMSHTLTEAGDFYLAVADVGGNETSNYGLYLQSLTNPGNAIPLFSGQIVTETITGLADMDTYTFMAEADTVLYLEANRLSGGLDPQLRLYNANGVLLLSQWGNNQAVISTTLTTAGSYTLLMSDYGGTDTGTYNLSATIIGPTTLALGEVYTSTIHNHETQFYVVPVAQAGQNLLVEVTPLTNVNQLWVEGRFGAIPFFGHYDVRTTGPTLRGTYELLISPSQAGNYFFSVFGRDVNPSPGTYQIVVNAVDRHLSDVTPRSGGNAGSITLNLSGLGFVEGMQVELRSAGLPTLAADEVTLASPTSLWAHFDLNGAAPGDYDVVAVWPGGGEKTLTNAFTITVGVGPCLEATIEAPSTVRLNRPYVLWLEYGNTGDANMLAPLLIISGSSSVLLSLSPDGPYTADPVQLLGINFNQPAGILTPGSQYTIPIYFQVRTAGQAQFTLESMIADTTPIDWAAIEADVRPDDLDPELWDVIWSNFTTQMGGTWAEYLAALDDQATYLAQYGDVTFDLPRLVAGIMGRASGSYLNQTLSSSEDAYSPARGLPLQFERVAFDTLYQRFTVGPFGRGWSHNFEYTLTRPDTDTIIIRGPGGATRSFGRNQNGAWQAAAGDYGALQILGNGSYQLREKDGQVWQFAANGTLTYIEEPNGNRITLTYSSGNLTQIGHSNGQSFTLAYNGQGRISRLTDHAGQMTDYTYDASGERLLNVVALGNVTTAYGYQPANGGAADHALTTIIYPDNTHQYYAYDAQGRLAAQWRDGDAERIEYDYDSLGIVFVTDAFNATTTIRLGSGGQPLALVDPLNNQARFQYDASFNLTQLTQPDGSAYDLAYDNRGNVIRVVNPLVDTTSMAYTSNLNRLDWLRDGRGNLRDFTYDSAGNLTAVTYPNGSSELYAYDSNGNLTASTNRRGDTITFTYNALGQVTGKDYPDGSAITYTYDSVGRLNTVTDATGVIDLDYDSRGFLTRIEYPSGHWFTFAYNDAGQRTQRVGDDGYTLTYQYDAAGRLERLLDDNGDEVIRYEYDAAGRLAAEWKGNGTYTIYSYDAAGQLLSLVNYAPDDTVQSHFDYTYDANGNRISMNTLDGTTNYEYDALGQLTGVLYPDGPVTTYEYDAVGNRLRVTDDHLVTHYTTNNMDQYTQVGSTTYTYDADGNMIAQTDASSTTTYDFDIENRLTGVVEPDEDTWSYIYDALNNRVVVGQNSVVTNYLHDPVGFIDLVAEYDVNGVLLAHYHHGFGLVSRVDAGGIQSYYAFDGTAHTRQVTNEFGALANTYDYDVFGTLLQVSESIPNLFRYVGKFGVADDGNSLTYMRNRYYEPVKGRFVSLDPLGLSGGNINLYTYAGNSPANFIDPMGLFIPPGLTDRSASAGLGLEFNRTPESSQHDSSRSSKQNSPRSKTEAAIALTSPTTWFTGVGLGECGGYYKDCTDEKYREDNNINYDDLNEAQKAFWRHDHACAGTASCLDVTDPDVLKAHGALFLDLLQILFTAIAPVDPNEKTGPTGIGPQNTISVDEDLHYTVYFENIITATAPAQEVFILDQLDVDLDWFTFQSTEFAFGDIVVAVPPGVANYTTQVTIPDYRPNVHTTWLVDITVEINYDTGAVQLTFRTLDPLTGELPDDALAGFLPPEDGTGRGQGHVSFSIMPKPTAPLGTVITNEASIIFDTNEPIVTNQVWNTIGLIADLALVMGGSPDPVTAATPVTYTLVISNDGPEMATGVVVTDTLPAGVTLESVNTSQGSCSLTGPVVCSLGDIDVAASATIVIVVMPVTEGVISNTAVVTSTSADPNPDNNSATTTTTVTPAPGYRLFLPAIQKS